MVIAELDKSIIHFMFNYKRKKVMKKGRLIIIPAIILLFIGCARDNLYEDALIGTWEAHSIEQNGEWVNMSKASNMQMSITINSSGTYSTSGYLGNISGTWHLSKRNITFKTEEQEHMKCHVIDLWQDKCELTITKNNESIHVKCNKKK